MKTLYELMTAATTSKRTQNYHTTYRPGGGGRRTGTTFPPPGHFPRQQTERTEGIQINNCHRMFSWQKDIVQELVSNDIYVVASPGAGKTLPIICYWSKHILKLNPELLKSISHPHYINKTELILMARIKGIIYNNSRKMIPKLIYSCPVRQLIGNISTDFFNAFEEIIRQGILLYQKASINNLRIQEDMGGSSTHEMKKFESEFEDLIEILVKDSSIRNNTLIKLREYKTLYNQFYNYRKRPNPEDAVLKQLYERLLTNAYELQTEIIPIIHNFIKKKLIANLSHTSEKGDKDALVIIAIHESTKHLDKSIIKNTNLFVIDEAHQMQHFSENDRAKQISKSVYKLINNIPNSSRLAFLSGTVHPDAAENLCDYIRKCFKRNIKIIKNIPAGNKSNISVIANDKLSDFNYLLKLLMQPEDTGNVILLFSTKQIKNLVEKVLTKKPSGVSLQQIEKGTLNKNTPFKEYDFKSKYKKENKYKDLSDKEIKDLKFKGLNKPKDTSISGRDAMDIYDDVLRESIKIGIGYIYRKDADANNDQTILKKYEHDKQIVVKLFKEGKIHTVLATDAIGIGVNLDIKNLYIPSLSKPLGNNKGFGEPLISDLSQLLNRVGRAKYAVSSIYTIEDYVPSVLNALSSGPEQFEKRITIKSKLQCNYKIWQFLYKQISIFVHDSILS